MKSDLILASASPWRAKLLSWIVSEFEVVVSGFDEDKVEFVDPGDYVEKLARSKAELVSRGGAVVIGADTVIYHRGKVIGKPGNIEEAREVVGSLSGREHEVYTGIAMFRGGELVHSKAIRSTVWFEDLGSEALIKYLESGESLGKAGAYSVVTREIDLIEKVEGSVSSVVGLPLEELAEGLRDLGLEIDDFDERELLAEKLGFEVGQWG